MKATLALIPAFTLLSTAVAGNVWMGSIMPGYDPLAKSLDSNALPLSEAAGIDVRFSDLRFFYNDPQVGEPKNTLLARIETTLSKIVEVNRQVVFNVTGLRTAMKSVKLGIRACDEMQTYCYPQTSSDNNQFNHKALAHGNIAAYNVTDYGKAGDIRVFLQFVEQAGQDNPEYSAANPLWVQNNPTFYNLVSGKQINNTDVAFTISLVDKTVNPAI